MKSKIIRYYDFDTDQKYNRLRQKTIIKIGVYILLFFLIVSSGFLITSEHLEANVEIKNQHPTFTYLFGTDWLGRDMLARTLKGLNTSFQVGTIAAFMSTCIALGLSLLASVNKVFDFIVTNLIDLFLSVPHLVTLILIVFVFGGGVKGVILGIAFTHWPTLTRLLRAEIMQIKTAEYVRLSKMQGKSRFWVLQHHFLPHLFPQIFVGFTLLFPHAILHESAITFLGFGLSSEQPAIGIILSESMKYLSTGIWWLAFFPGLLLVMMVVIFDALGNNIRKYLNPNEMIRRD